MKKLSCVLILAAALSSPVWAADCKIPPTPKKLPVGSTASKDEMLAAKNLVGEYQSGMDTYLACIKGEYEAQLAKYPKGNDDLKKQFMETYKKKNDAAVDTQEEFVGRFNEQVRAYNAAKAAK